MAARIASIGAPSASRMVGVPLYAYRSPLTVFVEASYVRMGAGLRRRSSSQRRRAPVHQEANMRTRLLLRTITIAGAVTLTALVGGAAAANPAVSDDQPLPPYTISNPPMAPIVANGALTTVFQGIHEHAAHDVEVPAQWNGDLVVWAHGFRGQGTVLDRLCTELRAAPEVRQRGVRVGGVVIHRQRLRHPGRGTEQ